MKFLVDVGVGKSVELWLRTKGFGVKCIIEIDPTLTDKNILQLANTEHRIVVTIDNDFGELVFNGKHSMHGVLLLRLEDATGQEKVKIIEQIFENYSSSLPNNFCVFQNNKLRVKAFKK